MPADRDRQMEEYLRNMKNLRAQMNEFEETAASVSVEEQKQKTAIAAIEKDLESVRLETKRLNAEASEMMNAKTQIHCQILERQKRICSFEIEYTTLSQTLELLQKETIAFQEKLKEERVYYENVRDALNSKLHDQQDWANSQKLKLMPDTVSAASVEESAKKPMCFAEGRPRNELPSIDGMTKDKCFELTANHKDLMNQLESARTKAEELRAKVSEISHDNKRAKQLIAEFQVKIEAFPFQLRAMEAKTLEEEHQALLADKAGELEYLQSLQERIGKLQGMSEVVKCQCREEYRVSAEELDAESQR